MKFFILSLFFFPLLYFFPEDSISSEKEGVFSGRISRVNARSGLVRIKVNFSNFRYLNKKDKVSFWDKGVNLKKCHGFIMGKTNEYLLLRVPNYTRCQNLVYLKEGAYLTFFSQDLINNIKMGRELMSILKKKRMALLNKVKRNKRELETYIEKVDAVNGRYSSLRKKLDREWKRELSLLEEDRVDSRKKFGLSVIKLEEVEFKMEQYKVEERNLKLDRWSLDSKLYFRK